MRTGGSPFSSPAQPPGVTPASRMRFMCLQPTTPTSPPGRGRVKAGEVVRQMEEAIKEQSVLAF